MDVIQSLKQYIDQCMSEFSLDDFSPSFDNHDLALKFANIFYKKNAYWEEAKTEDKWPRWVFIKFKSFTKDSSRLILGIYFTNNKIAFALTINLEYFNGKTDSEILRYDVWLDHNKLCEKLHEVILKGIADSNTP